MKENIPKELIPRESINKGKIALSILRSPNLSSEEKNCLCMAVGEYAMYGDPFSDYEKYLGNYILLYSNNKL